LAEGLRRSGAAAGNGRGRRSAARLTAFALCVLFIALTALSTAYILTHANHRHDHNGPGGDCAVCVRINAAERLLKTISTAAAGAALVFGGVFALLSARKVSGCHKGFYSLIRLKVRLNN
jgi:hypothetical protein